jgi:hypothetical protein
MPASYNREVRIPCLLVSVIALAGCQSGNQDRAAVHQGIIDHLSQAGLTPQNMDISETSVKFDGDKADAVVQITPKGAGQSQGMQMRYSLQQKSGRWEVTGRAGSSGHGAAVAPGSPNPHGGAMPGAAPPDDGNHHMPSPGDLPPAGKKR